MNRVFALLFVSLLACTAEKAGGSSAEAPPTEPEPVTAARVEEKKPNPMEEIMTLASLTEAFEYGRPHMEDTRNETSLGANLFGLWAAQNLTWSDLNSVGETRFSLVKKDSDSVRGQRICRGGRVVQIAVDRYPGGKVFRGLFMTSDRDIASFIAAKSTGELVEGSWAKFCGLVIGNYTYSNSGGGTSHAVQLVGMFDLPENKL